MDKNTETEKPANSPADPSHQKQPTENEPVQESENKEPEPAPAEKNDDPLSQIGAEFVKDWPEPVEHFVNATRERAEEQERADLGELDPLQIKDKNGHYFNPDLCAVGDDGLPKFTKKGMFELKRGVKRSQLKKRPIQAKDAPDVSAKIEAARAEAEAQELLLRVKQNAALGMAGYVQLNSFLHSEEVVQEVLGAVLMQMKDAQGKEQKLTFYDVHQLSLERALTACNGGPELNPWMQLGAVFGFSSLMMGFHKKHERRRKTVKEWLAVKWLRLRAWRSRRPAQAKGEGAEQ